MKKYYRSKSSAGASLPHLLVAAFQGRTVTGDPFSTDNHDGSATFDQPDQISAPAVIFAAVARCKMAMLAVIGLTLGIVLPTTGRAQLLGSLTEGSASAPYAYYLTVQFANGHYYDFTLNSPAASYTGTSFINAVAAGSQGTSLVLNVTQTAYSFGNAITGIMVNTDTNTGFTNNSYWNYWLGSATNPVTWTYSSTGEDGRTISPGQADGWVYEGSMTAPTATSFAVPEPSTWALAAVGLAVYAAGTLRRRSVAA